MRHQRLGSVLLAVSACGRQPYASTDDIKPSATPAGPAMQALRAADRDAASRLFRSQAGTRLAPTHGDTMPSLESGSGYSAKWAGSDRGSHVHVGVRTLANPRRLITLDDDPTRISPRSTEGIWVAPGSINYVVQRSGWACLFDVVHGFIREIFPSGALCSKEYVFDKGRPVGWFGEPGPIDAELLGNAWGVWAQQYSGGVYRAAFLQLTSNGDFSSESLVVVVAPAPYQGLDLSWHVYLRATAGVAAISKDGTIFLGIRDRSERTGRLLAYSGEAARSEAELHDRYRPSVEVALSFSPYEVSVGRQTVALLEASGIGTFPGDAAAAAYSAVGDVGRKWISNRPARRWHTRLHLFSSSGKALSSIQVPFEVLQPPVWAGQGRLYLVGNGLAAVENGTIRWARISHHTLWGTAYDAGELALASGNTLEIVDFSGHVRQSLELPDRDARIQTPPAITEDGAVWVATDNAVYVAQ